MHGTGRILQQPLAIARQLAARLLRYGKKNAAVVDLQEVCTHPGGSFYPAIPELALLRMHFDMHIIVSSVRDSALMPFRFMC